MIRETARELVEIVRANGGGNFTASVYLREDGFFILFNEPFLDRIARAGRGGRFAELLKTHFEEALRDATEKSKRSVNGGEFAAVIGRGEVLRQPAHFIGGGEQRRPVVRLGLLRAGGGKDLLQ